MLIFSLIASWILGTIVGSFLGVIVARMHTGMTLVGRSKCFSCNRELRWYELIPVASYLLQRGRCRSCGSKIPNKVFLIELTTGFVFLSLAAVFVPLALAQSFVWLTFGVFLMISALLVVLSFYDIEHTIVPDKVVIPFILISFVLMFFITPSESFVIQTTPHLPNLWHGLAGILIPLPFFAIWLFSKGRLLGFGDIKLMVGVGWLLGLAHGISAVVISFWIGALWSLVMMFLQHIHKLYKGRKRFILSSEIPFAPFLALGLLLVIIFRINLFTIPFM